MLRIPHHHYKKTRKFFIASCSPANDLIHRESKDLTENRELVSGCKVDIGRGIWQWLILGNKNMRHSFSVIAALATEILTWFALLCDWGLSTHSRNLYHAVFLENHATIPVRVTFFQKYQIWNTGYWHFLQNLYNKNLDGLLNIPKILLHCTLLFSRRVSSDLCIELNIRVRKSGITHLITLMYSNVFQISDIYCLLLHTSICIRGKGTKIRNKWEERVKLICHC